ncbi:PEPxxWA-CTERM sorting domain-containing protein [Sphingomonas sp. 1P08PE]|uniref:PEPxxWA-CTERM sorting domain-containing protein n=1 Tax=Sphingomonas sp. 1P08PE TaxID=554122 RepID=UPI0039A1C0D9
MRMALTMAAVFAAMSATQASAAQFAFQFTTVSTAFGGPDQNGSGVFTTSDVATTVEGRTAFAITGISGQINNVAISGLTPESTSLIPTYYYFTQGATFLNGTGVRFDAGDFKGISFFAPDFADSPRYRIRGNGTILANVTATSSAVGPVPEPATWAMMLVGFSMVGAATRYRRRSAKVAFA